MEEKQYDTIDVDITEMNRNVLQFCGGILTQFQDVLSNREKEICKLLLEGRSRTWICDNYGITRERVRQIFFKSIKKINNAYDELLQKNEKDTLENEQLKHKVFALEQEMLSFQNKEKREGFATQEQSLCSHAARLLDVPVRFLPLSVRAIHVLEDANALTFKEIPLLSVEQLYQIKQCGSKTIHDIKNYLSKFGLELGLLYDDVITRLSKLSNTDIAPESFGDYRAKKTPIVITHTNRAIENSNQIKQMTLSQFFAEIGQGKRAKKWSSKILRILRDNQIDTLEKFMSMKPCEFEALKGVGPSTLKYAKRAFDHFGLVWSNTEDNPFQTPS